VVDVDTASKAFACASCATMPKQKLWPRNLDGSDPDDPAHPIALNNFKQISRGWETESGLYEQLWQSQKQEEKNLMMELR
jgi:hypothetical protein